MHLDPTITGAAMLVAMLVFLFSGMPIAFALGVAGVFGLAMTRSWPSLEFLLSTFPYSASSNLAYIVLPLFLFMGYMAFAAGVASRAFDTARTWFGAIPGGLPISTVFASSCFAAVSGSSVATAATVAQVAIPEMLRHKYNQRIAAGCVAAAGTLGVLIPPSGILVIYSIATEVPITDLFVAAFIPGVLTAVAYMALLYFWVQATPAVREATVLPPAPWRERFHALGQSWEVIALFSLVMGTIYLGLATATEAAAFGAAGALAIVVFRRKNRREIIWRGLVDTGVATSSIFALVIGAGLFGLGLATTQIPQNLASWVAGFSLEKWQLTIFLILPYLILGCFIDAISMLLLTLPVVFPVVVHAGINPVLFGILVTKCTEIGAITPPVGLNVFVVKNTVPELQLGECFKGAVPFVLIELVLIGLLVAFPQIVTFPLK